MISNGGREEGGLTLDFDVDQGRRKEEARAPSPLAGGRRR